MSDETTGESGTRVLIVDDDAELCGLLSEYLTTRGFVVECEGDGERGLERARQGQYSIMVLDVMLPGLDGFEVLRRLRTSGTEAAHLPVVMLTAHGDEVDRIVGLELGADDYLSKPFNSRELLARVRAILRRSGLAAAADGSTATRSTAEGGPTAASERICVGDIEVDVAARAVLRSGEVLELTAAEFDLLHALMRVAGRVVSREELARDVFKRRLLPFDRSLDMHVSKLRHKLGPAPGGAERIKTVRTVGYIYVKDKS